MESVELVCRPDASFWSGRRVLLTGHTGFKGSWLAIWLHRLGAKVTGISLPPSIRPNLFSLARIEKICCSHFCDIRDAAAFATHVQDARPEIVIHLAAQALVRVSYREPIETFSTNVMGTAHLLDALCGLSSVKIVVLITTDKVYRNNEWPWPYREEDALGGYDPYSASKAASELVIASYRDAFLREQGVAVASARAGNVIGGGDWSEDRLIPDAMRAWLAGDILHIRRPRAIRPWQHVVEPLAGYLALAQALSDQPQIMGAYNFGPQTADAATVHDVVEMARTANGSGQVHYGDGAEGPHEAGWLALEIAKAREALGYRPRWDLPTSMQRTVAWYRALQDGAPARALCEADIAAYEKLL